MSSQKMARGVGIQGLTMLSKYA